MVCGSSQPYPIRVHATFEPSSTAATADVDPFANESLENIIVLSSMFFESILDHKQFVLRKFFIRKEGMQKKKRKGKKAPAEKKLTDLELGIRGYGSK